MLVLSWWFAFVRKFVKTTIKEIIMAYVDGFVVPVPKAKLDAYLAMSRACGAVWREYGALEFRECVGDDVKPGKLTSFPQAVDLQDGEVVVFFPGSCMSRAPSAMKSTTRS